MCPQIERLAWVLVVGGAAVLISYAYSQASERATQTDLRGGIPIAVRPLLLFNHLLPFARRRYQALDGRVQRQHWADQAKGKSNHGR